jgi:hypothetical protein
MNTRQIFIFFFFCLVILPLRVSAEDVEHLYEAEVAVPSQASADRLKAIQQGFQQVLVKVTGQSTILTVPAVRTLNQQARSFVQQYRYSSRPLPDGDGEQRYLWVQFNQAALDKALWDQGIQVWGRARPSTLVWLAIEDGTQRYLVNANTAEVLHAELMAQAKRRGIPVFFPLLDLQDQRLIKFSDVWGNFRQAILTASERYNMEAVLVGKGRRSETGYWEMNWTYYFQGQTFNWLTHKSLEQNIASVIDNTADLLSARFALKSGSGEQAISLQVLGISRLEDYAVVTRYLESLSMITSVETTLVDEGSAVFRLGLRGDQSTLAQALSLGADKILVPAGTRSDVANSTLIYRLVR